MREPVCDGERQTWDARQGSIVNIIVGVTLGVPNKFSYITSKGGVNFMTMSAALDLAPCGIRVNAIGSGPVGTAVGYRTMEGRTSEPQRAARSSH